MITAYAAYCNQDMTEGRGPIILDKVFVNEKDAQDYINQQVGVMGRKPSDFGKPDWQNSDMNDWQVKPFYIFEHLEDGEEYERAQALDRANRKLTSKERAALEFQIRQSLT